MESQLHHTHVHDEHEHGGETKSAMKKVKAKIEKLKDTVKHGHGHHNGEDHGEDTKTVNDSLPVRSGLVEPTVMGTPVLAEDLYATHSDIVDPPVRSFAQWEEEERHGAPPPLSTGYGTRLTDVSQFGHDVYGQDVNREQLRGSIEKSTGMEEDPSAPSLTTAVSPANYQTKVTDPTNTGGKEAGITDVLKSFNKMGVYDESHSKSPKSDQNEAKVYTGSHDQFAPEPVENPPLDTIAANPSNPNSSYSQKVASATSAISDKAAAAKDTIVSKLGFSGENKSDTSTGSNKTNKNSSFSTDFAHKVADTMTGTFVPVYEKVVTAKTTVMSKIQGSGQDDDNKIPATSTPESKKVTVREYLVDTFRPGDEDKVLSEVITNAFHRGKGNAPQETVTNYAVRDEGERRLQDSSN
ncbi:hypothetical protein L1887_16881 [Cichorium endivia]|nr:hypothetical protein L1887_16881 [Cichorium endivia]